MTPQDQNQGSPIQAVSTDTVREQDKIQLVLSYLGLLALIPLLTVKDSPFVQWHAKQGLALFIGIVVVSIVLGIIPVVNMVAGCVVPLGALVVSVLAIMKAFKGERWRIPVIADLSEKF